MLQCNNILNILTCLKPFLYNAFFIAKVLATSGIFIFFHFAVLYKSINSELNANEINLHTFYSATLVQLMFISFNTLYPE